MQVIEQYTAAKSTTTPSEDAVVVNAYYAAVIDGATPKTDFRFPEGETPGHLAARLIADAIMTLPPTSTGKEAIDFISSAMRQGFNYPHLPSCNRPIASVIIFSALRREVWMVGDCQYLLPESGIEHQGSKMIDRILSEWRRDIDSSLLSRGIMTEEAIRSQDPGRAIIQPHITRQVRYQNRADGHPLAYAMLDGSDIPQSMIQVFCLPSDCHQLVMATDGYPKLFPTLEETERHLAKLLKADPLCIGALTGTKCILPGNISYDDRTYLSIEI